MSLHGVFHPVVVWNAHPHKQVQKGHFGGWPGNYSTSTQTYLALNQRDRLGTLSFWQGALTPTPAGQFQKPGCQNTTLAFMYHPALLALYPPLPIQARLPSFPSATPARALQPPF